MLFLFIIVNIYNCYCNAHWLTKKRLPEGSPTDDSNLRLSGCSPPHNKTPMLYNDKKINSPSYLILSWPAMTPILLGATIALLSLGSHYLLLFHGLLESHWDLLTLCETYSSAAIKTPVKRQPVFPGRLLLFFQDTIRTQIFVMSNRRYFGATNNKRLKDWILKKFVFLIFLTQIEGSNDVVHCTDCKAPWGKLLFMILGYVKNI